MSIQKEGHGGTGTQEDSHMKTEAEVGIVQCMPKPKKSKDGQYNRQNLF